MRKGHEGELELSPNLLEQMYACFDCMACNDACPVGIKPADLAVDMRQMYEKEHPAFWKQALFGGLIPKPERMELAALAFAAVPEAWSAPPGVCAWSDPTAACSGA